MCTNFQQNSEVVEWGPFFILGHLTWNDPGHRFLWENTITKVTGYKSHGIRSCCIILLEIAFFSSVSSSCSRSVLKMSSYTTVSTGIEWVHYLTRQGCLGIRLANIMPFPLDKTQKHVCPTFNIRILIDNNSRKQGRLAHKGQAHPKNFC